MELSKEFLNNLLKNYKIRLAFLQNQKNYENIFQLNLQDNQKAIQIHILNYLSKDLFNLSNDDRRYFLKIFLDNIRNFIDNKIISSIFDGFQLFFLIKFFENILLQHIPEENIFSILKETTTLLNLNCTQVYQKEKLSDEAKELLLECGVFECIWALLEKK